MVDCVVDWPLVGGNRVVPLVNGDQAYPAMLKAIDQAQTSVTLATYLFNNDVAGRSFVEALARAVARKVEVRVLVDAVGARYSFPTILGPLRKARIPVQRFMPVAAPWRMPFWNLRDHRKSLVVDGRKAFTGGMNIAKGNLIASNPRRAVQDLQFEVEGPVVAHIQEAFAEDWFFTAKEDLKGELWFPALAPAGTVHARGIPDGPDADYDKLAWTLLAALSAARSSIRIVTPYFLPDTALIAALNTAALSGVQVDIVLTGKNNLPFVQWACQAELWQVLEKGCRVWLTPPPFDHSKLMIVDGVWAFVGSANWDPRSLRLNFEFNLECYDAVLAAALDTIVESKLRPAKPLTMADMDGRALPTRLRDGVARLFSPYL
jgi:cardiolipin synthase